jgi:hypothetical protein
VLDEIESFFAVERPLYAEHGSSQEHGHCYPGLGGALDSRAAQARDRHRRHSPVRAASERMAGEVGREKPKELLLVMQARYSGP